MNKLLLSTLSLGAISIANAAYCSEKPKPNVLFIFLDDLTHDAIGALGNRGVITPNIDKLVEDGTAFTSAYMMGGWHGAYSVASRSQLITGRYMWHSLSEERAKYRADLESQSTWPQMMKQAGYKTYMTGKWHVEHINPTSLFDVVDTPRKGGMPNTVETSYNRPLEGEVDPWSPYDTSNGGFWQGGKHWSEVQADVAIDFISQSNESEEPFFIYCAFNAPHDPRQAPKEYVDMYPLDQIDLPENFLPVHPMYQAMGSVPEGRDEALAPYPPNRVCCKDSY
ncbi:MAG: sulfatase-like hydrolase/transferase [Rikenellaceae bacterium]